MNYFLNSDQIVIVRKEDYDAMVNEQANKIISVQKEQPLQDVTKDGEIIKPIICDGVRYVTRIDASKLLDVGLPTLWRWNKEGRLHAIKVGAHRVYYKYEDVIAILKGE